jgi:hypothetical protein
MSFFSQLPIIFKTLNCSSSSSSSSGSSSTVGAVSPDTHKGSRSNEIFVGLPSDQPLLVEGTPKPSQTHSEGVDCTSPPKLPPFSAVKGKGAELGVVPNRPVLTLGAPRGGWKGRGTSSERGEEEAERGGGRGGERGCTDDLGSSSGVTASRKVTPMGTAAAKDFLEEHSAFLHRCGRFYSACLFCPIFHAVDNYFVCCTS